jgi:Mg2+ and Co2+ transporter CorA
MNVPPGWALPEAIAVRLGERSGRQRAMTSDGHLLLVLHQVPGEDSAERKGAFFWRSEDGQWHAGDGGHGVVAVQSHLSTYDQAVEQLEADYDRARTAREYFRILETIVPLHRAASNQHAALQAARESLPEVREIISLRDLAGDIERAAELLHADVKNALDFRVAEQAEQQAKSAHEMSEAGHRLNLLAALFLPASVIGGAFGTSLNSGLENAPTWLFWAVLFGSLLFGIFLYQAMSKRTA